MDPVWPLWRFLFSLIILSAIMILPISTGIKCFHCKDKSISPGRSHPDFSCSTMVKRTILGCQSDQYACIKTVTFNAGQDEFGRMRHIVNRDCLDPHSQNYSSLQFCDRGEMRGPPSPGHEGVVCICDTDFCNGSLGFKFRRPQSGMILLGVIIFLVLNWITHDYWNWMIVILISLTFFDTNLWMTESLTIRMTLNYLLK